MKPNFDKIASQFRFTGKFAGHEPYGNGHINDSYAIWFENGSGSNHRYLLQHLNHQVFKQPEQVMENITAVTRHLREKILDDNGNPERETLNLIPTTEGNSYYRSDEGDYWRAYTFIEDADSYEVANTLDHVYNAALAIGQFQQRISDLPAQALYETIPDFHHTQKRFSAFVNAVQRDSQNRAKSVKNEIDFYLAREDNAAVIINLLEENAIPQRVTHNDTKFNNVLIDNETGDGICVVDLDTVMPGSALYDFGDLVRSATNTEAEDERDLNKVNIDMAIYENLVCGYLDSARHFLTDTEIEHLAFSAKLLTLECGMRFLTDYLQGDQYFRIHREHHNLDRARTQIKMVQGMEENAAEMHDIVEKHKYPLPKA